jgi:hypothetical protein
VASLRRYGGPRVNPDTPPARADRRSSGLRELGYAVAMNWLLITAALACNPGDRLVDLRDKIPRGMNSIYLVVTVDPFYSRFYIYQPGFPDSVQHCGGNRPTSVIKVPVVDGRYCIRQSQPQMKWTVRAMFVPDLQM